MSKPSKKQVEDSIATILKYIGEDPERTGLKDTPNRVVRMYDEILRGYDETQKPKITTFNNGDDGIVYDNMVIDEGKFYSMCEHHMMPFFGNYWFAYIPHEKGRILGLSKIARVVDFCSARLQVQERLVYDVVKMIEDALTKDSKYQPLGIAMVMKGEHLCKTMRGVKKQGLMTSSHLTGVFKSDIEVRTEFMNLINR
jgi:GTP cyclohydrolase I